MHVVVAFCMTFKRSRGDGSITDETGQTMSALTVAGKRRRGSAVRCPTGASPGPKGAANSLGSNFPLTTTVATAIEGLLGGLANIDGSLPIGPVEPVSFAFTPGDGAPVGHIYCHAFPPAASLALSPLARHVLPGCPAGFLLGLRPGAGEELNAGVLSSVAAVARVQAVLVTTGDRAMGTAAATTPGAAPLPYTCKPAVGGISISVSVPAGALEGSRVIILSASVAGVGIPLGEGPGNACVVTLGFKHVPLPEGPVMAAAMAGDVPALWRALENGGSTGERDEVSTRLSYPTLTSVARPPPRKPLRVRRSYCNASISGQVGTG